MLIIDTEKVVIKSWCNNPEEGAIQQAKNLANLPFTFKQVCLMPDTHEGYGMPIGGVVALTNAVIPNAVGVDIGCGMLAVKTSLTDINKETLKQIMGKIRGVIPVGFDHQKEKMDDFFIPPMNSEISSFNSCVKSELEKSFYQVGTLGGGNHFIEIQKGSDDYIWFMIHSGSRNVGLKVANYYIKLAKEINGKWFSEVRNDLYFFPLDNPYASQYLTEMNWCLNFSKCNRELMSLKIKEIFNDITGTDFGDEINIHHNYASMENHFGKNVMIHRKGATLARQDTIGIIPGSQGTSSYIVKGKGNPDSFMSSSHGAGRRMGRNQAIKTLDLSEEQRKLDDLGIIHSVRNKKDLDEAPGSYKDISVVMEEQKDLVDILVELKPLAVIKG